MLDRNLVLPHRLSHLADVDPDGLAMLDVDGRTATFAEARDTMRAWAAGYARLGVRESQPVLTLVPNSFESYYAWLGLAWLKALEVPTNTMYRGTMLAYLLNNSGAEIAVMSARFLDRLAEVAGDVEHLKTVVVPDADGELPALPFEVITGDQFLDGAPTDGIGDGPEYYDIACIIYTSGTTGPSKGVLVPWAELYEFVRIMPPETLPEGRALYTTYPAFHVSGKAMLYATADRHGQLVLRESFSLSEFWNDIRRFDCYSCGLVGPMAALLMLNPPADDDADNPLQTTFMGPIVPQVDEFKVRFGVDKVGTGFGMTEVGAPLSSNGFTLVNNTSCGRRRTGPPGYQVRIVDEHDEEVPTGTVGELVVRADDPWVINAGYWNLPEKTADAWRNGWFHTGDGFREDDDGNFYFVDRLKDAIRRRGENISSFEVEAGVNAHPAVQECAVIGVPSELGEDDVKAVIVLRPDTKATPEEIVEFLEPRMPRFMIPRYIEFVDALPKTDATFRTQKVKLRDNAINANTWDREPPG